MDTLFCGRAEPAAVLLPRGVSLRRCCGEIPGKERQNLRYETGGDAVAVMAVVTLESVSHAQARESLIELRVRGQACSSFAAPSRRATQNDYGTSPSFLALSLPARESAPKTPPVTIDDPESRRRDFQKMCVDSLSGLGRLHCQDGCATCWPDFFRRVGESLTWANV
jgi:hypothetical protein